jgi:hypothetical protein
VLLGHLSESFAETFDFHSPMVFHSPTSWSIELFLLTHSPTDWRRSLGTAAFGGPLHMNPIARFPLIAANNGRGAPRTAKQT